MNNEIPRSREGNREINLTELTRKLSEDTRRRNEKALEVGTSKWKTTIPIRAKSFSLNKKDLTDSIALRYGG